MSINFSTDIEKPFEFYENLIFNGSITTVLDLFYQETIITQNYYLVLERNKEFTFEKWVGKKDSSDLIDYNQHFILVLAYHRKKAFECLDKNLKNIDKKKQINVINFQLTKLSSYFEKCKTAELKNFNKIIQDELINIISDFKIKYSYLVSFHNAYIQIEDDENKIDSLFVPKSEIKRSFFKELYKLLMELDLIDDIVVDEDVFLDVFTSNKPQVINKIIFIRPNPIVAYFLKEIEPFFNNLNGVSIEKSKCFLNKQNKPLTATDLYTALSRGKVKNQDFQRRIDSKISKLKETYLG